MDEEEVAYQLKFLEYRFEQNSGSLLGTFKWTIDYGHGMDYIAAVYEAYRRLPDSAIATFGNWCKSNDERVAEYVGHIELLSVLSQMSHVDPRYEDILVEMRMLLAGRG